MYLLIEKIEGPWAVIEWGKESFTIPKFLLPGNAQPGDKVQIEIKLYKEDLRLRRERPAAIAFDDVE